MGQDDGTKTGVFIYKTSSNEWKCLWHCITGVLRPLLQKLLMRESVFVGYEQLAYRNVCRAVLVEQLVEPVTDTI
jgi:hypothetical protein